MRLREVGLQLGFRTDPKEFRQTSVKKILQFKVTDVASMFPAAFLSIEKSGSPLHKGFPLVSRRVEGGTRTHDIQNHNLTL